MKTPDLLSNLHWSQLLETLPADLEETAKRCGAFCRRRELKSASDLLRMILALSVSDLSIKDTVAWAIAQGVADMSAPAFYYRFCQSEQWLEVLLKQMLRKEVGAAPKGARLRVVDATVLTGPGAKGTEWRVHTAVNPSTGCIETLELTDEHGGEGIGRFPLQPGDVVLGDRAYPRARGIAALEAQGAYLIARLCPNTLRLCNQNNEVVRPKTWENEIPAGSVRSWNLLVPVPPDGEGHGNKSWKLSKAKQWIPARVIGLRTEGEPSDQKEVWWFITTVPEAVADDSAILELYRVRWQIETCLKRLKSIGRLDKMVSRQGPSAKSWIFGRLLGAALAQARLEPVPAFFPCGGGGGRPAGIQAQSRVQTQRMEPVPDVNMGNTDRSYGGRSMVGDGVQAGTISDDGVPEEAAARLHPPFSDRPILNLTPIPPRGHRR